MRRFSADPRVTPPTFPLPIIPAGHPLTVVTLGTTIPPTSSHGQTGTSPVYVQVGRKVRVWGFRLRARAVRCV